MGPGEPLQALPDLLILLLKFFGVLGLTTRLADSDTPRLRGSCTPRTRARLPSRLRIRRAPSAPRGCGGRPRCAAAAARPIRILEAPECADSALPSRLGRAPQSNPRAPR